MNQPKLILWRFLARKLGVIALLLVTAGAFATLGEGHRSEGPKTKSLLTTTPVTKPGTFSLRSGYSYRGSHILTQEKTQIRLNTVVTVQRGNTTYIVPLKKKEILQKVKIQFGNQQFRRN